MRKARKLVGSVLGSLTAGVVMGVAAAFGVSVDVELAAAIVAIAAAAGTWISPANEEA